MDINQAFRLLKLDAGASQDVVRRRYHELAARWHPDRQSPNSPDKHQAAEKMRALNAAYAFIRRFSETHLILVCKHCGAANSRPKDVNVEYAGCGNCGKQLQRATPRERRTPCGNGRCAGTIGSNGRCNFCGMTAAEGRASARAGGAADARAARFRLPAGSAVRIAKTFFLVAIACASVAAAALYYTRSREQGVGPVKPAPETAVETPARRDPPLEAALAGRCSYTPPARVIPPLETHYLNLFKKHDISKEEIARLQRMLKTIGYKIEKVDGAAGQNTAACLRQYAADVGYDSTDRFPRCFFEHADRHAVIAAEHPDWLDIYLSGELGRWVAAQPEPVRREIHAAAGNDPHALVQLMRRYKFGKYKPLPKLLPETGILNTAHPAGTMRLRIGASPGKNHYLVKLISLEGRKEALSAFIRSGGALTLRLPPGGFELTYAAGATWFGPEYLFGSSAAYGRLSKVILLIEGNPAFGIDTIEVAAGAKDGEPISEFDF